MKNDYSLDKNIKNILLLGGSGFVGKNLIYRFLLQSKFKVFVFDKMNTFEKKINKKIKFYQDDLTNYNSIIDIINCNNIDTVFHCISTLLPSSDFIQYTSDVEEVLLPSIAIIDYCAKKNIKFIYLSSGGTIYGNQDKVLTEQDPASPISFYGLSKLQIEENIMFYNRRYGLNFLILRPSNLYGYGQNLFGKQGLIAVLLGKILKNDSITIYGNGLALRDYIYIDDFTFYITELLNRNITNTILNVGSGYGYSVNYIISFLQKLSTQKISVNYTEARMNDVTNIVLDISKLNNLIPHTQIKLEDGIKDFFTKVFNPAETPYE
jgi:UDP-glucose 4-epimerase